MFPGKAAALNSYLLQFKSRKMSCKKPWSREKPAMFVEAELPAEAKSQAPQPHLKQLRSYPAVQHASCLHVHS